MHPMLQPIFPIKLAIASGALWCAWTVAAVLVHTGQISSPAPAAADPPPPIPVLARSDRLPLPQAFDDRWRAPAPAVQHAIMAEEPQIKPDKASGPRLKPRHAKRHQIA
nr:hypothetical protein [Bradyrhizobium sp. 6(2017)]QIG93779.1 hypothetical protein G6P99_15585 [Bradyrhizobium sp. 6(2017)]